MKKQAVMLYIIKDGKILFLVRNKKNDTVHEQGKLISIGGKVEEKESILSTVVREAQEEAGITVKHPELRAIIYFTNFGIERNDWIVFIHTAHDYDGTIRSGKEGSFVWKDVNQIDNLNVYDIDKVYFQLMQKHSFFVAEFHCDGHKLIEYTVLKAI